LLAGAADGLLDEAEQQAIRWDPAPRGPGSARWTPADAVLVDEASDLIERMPSLSHVVLDEAQDLSPMECRAVGRRCATGSATILGDLAQGTSPAATDSWPGLLAHPGKPDAQLRVLATGYRVPRQILDYANQLLGALAPGLAPVHSLREDPAALTVRPVTAAGPPTGLVSARPGAPPSWCPRARPPWPPRAPPRSSPPTTRWRSCGGYSAWPGCPTACWT